jgi:hypothetical protein
MRKPGLQRAQFMLEGVDSLQATEQDRHRVQVQVEILPKARDAPQRHHAAGTEDPLLAHDMRRLKGTVVDQLNAQTRDSSVTVTVSRSSSQASSVP